VLRPERPLLVQVQERGPVLQLRELRRRAPVRPERLLPGLLRGSGDRWLDRTRIWAS